MHLNVKHDHEHDHHTTSRHQPTHKGLVLCHRVILDSVTFPWVPARTATVHGGAFAGRPWVARQQVTTFDTTSRQRDKDRSETDVLSRNKCRHTLGNLQRTKKERTKRREKATWHIGQPCPNQVTHLRKARSRRHPLCRLCSFSLVQRAEGMDALRQTFILEGCRTPPLPLHLMWRTEKWNRALSSSSLLLYTISHVPSSTEAFVPRVPVNVLIQVARKATVANTLGSCRVMSARSPPPLCHMAGLYLRLPLLACLGSLLPFLRKFSFAL